MKKPKLYVRVCGHDAPMDRSFAAQVLIDGRAEGYIRQRRTSYKRAADGTVISRTRTLALRSLTMTTVVQFVYHC